MSNLIGQILLNQFRVDAFIASGGMGAVYRVWDLKRNAPLAMKVLHADLAEDLSIYKRFQREATALKKLAHPNIVPFYGLFQTLDITFILQNFIDGPSLKDVLKQRKGRSLSIGESITYLKTLCSALGYAHSYGVVHCDVKPGNVMLDRSGSIYLADFGIARHAESTTTTLGAAGTPAYMAPEQIRSEPVSPATDVYALGVMLFEMLTGQRPFRGTEAGTESAGPTAGERIRYAHLHLPPPDPRSLNSAISEALAQVVLKALEKKPAKRYRSTQELFVTACMAASLEAEHVADRLHTVVWSAPKSAVSISLEAFPSTAPATTPAHEPVRGRLTWLIGSAGLMFILGIVVVGILAIALLGGNPRATYPTDPGGREQPSVVLETSTSPNEKFSFSTSMPIVQPTNTLLPPTRIPPSPTPVLVFSKLSGKIAFATRFQGRHAIYILNLTKDDEPQLILLPSSSSGTYEGPLLSPDGTRIAFYIYSTNTQVIDSVPDAKPRILANCTEPSWSPDGKQIVCRAVKDGLFQLIDSRTGKAVQRTLRTGVIPSWSPAGGEIAFAKLGEERSSSIWRFSLDAQEPILLAGNGFENYAPVWSPDGKTIAYQYAQHKGDFDQIWIMDRNGQEARQITNMGSWAIGPAWSPDGQWLAFVSGEAGSIDSCYGEVFVISLTTGDIHQVTNTGGSVYCWRVSWSE